MYSWPCAHVWILFLSLSSSFSLSRFFFSSKHLSTVLFPLHFTSLNNLNTSRIHSHDSSGDPHGPALQVSRAHITSSTSLVFTLHCLTFLHHAGNNPEVLTSFHFWKMSSFLVGEFLLLIPKVSISLKHYINKWFIHCTLRHYAQMEALLLQLRWIFSLQSLTECLNSKIRCTPQWSHSRGLFARDFQIIPICVLTAPHERTQPLLNLPNCL